MLYSGSKYSLGAFDQQPSTGRVDRGKRRADRDEKSISRRGPELEAQVSGVHTDGDQAQNSRDDPRDESLGGSEDDLPQSIMAIASHGNLVGVAIYDPLQGCMSCLQFTDDAPKGALAHEQPGSSTGSGSVITQASSLHYQVP